MMQLSVVIPVYNARKYLRRCLDSVLAQTLREIEVICVDDGSTDGSAAILAKYAAKDMRIRVLTQENQGQGAARNRGLTVAHGEYIYFMDADDELAGPKAFEQVVGTMALFSLDLALFDAETHFDVGCGHLNGQIRAEAYIRRHDYGTPRNGRQMLVDMYRHKDWIASPPLAILRRDMLVSSGIVFPEGIIYEDNIFMLRVFLAAKRVAHRTWRLYVRKVHEGTTTTSRVTIANLKGYLACWRYVCEVLASKEGRSLPYCVRSALKRIGRGFKWHVCDIFRRLGEPLDCLCEQVSDSDATELRRALSVSVFEKAGNALRCLQDNGLIYTFKRILFGRQP